jgi:alkaline phosphatase D
MNAKKFTGLYFFPLFFLFTNLCYGANSDTIQPRHKVTLPEAHIGDLEIDTKLLDSYGRLPENIRRFYLDARAVFTENADADFSHPAILDAARKNELPLMGAPMLGNLREDGVDIWLRQATAGKLVVNIATTDGGAQKSFVKNTVKPGVALRIVVDGLTSGKNYNYSVIVNNQRVAEGVFKTAPVSGSKGVFKLAFGSCFHKIGLHNPNLINQILKREPHIMLLLGDMAVDDRENQINMHRADYLLRDVSKAMATAFLKFTTLCELGRS